MHRIILIFSLVVLLSGCTSGPRPESVLARVGDVALTQDQVKRSIDTTVEGWERQIPQTVTAWINAELLFQEAKRRGLDSKPDFRERADETYRQLLVYELLNTAIYVDTVAFPEEALRSYFQNHASEFFLREDVIRCNIAGFRTRDQALIFSARVAERNSWDDAVKQRMSDTTAASQMTMSWQGEYFTQRTIFPPELWKVAQTLPLNDVSFPIRSSAGYFIIQSLAILRQGSPAEFDFVRDEVQRRLFVDYRRKQTDQLIGTLRERTNVEIFVNPVSADDSTETPLQ